MEQKLFWLAPGRGDGLAAVGEAAHTRQPEVVERVLSTGRPSALTGLGAGAVMGLAETAAPRDGVTVLVAETELAAGLESIRFLLQVWGPALHVRLVLVRDEAMDVRQEVRGGAAAAGTVGDDAAGWGTGKGDARAAGVFDCSWVCGGGVAVRGQRVLVRLAEMRWQAGVRHGSSADSGDVTRRCLIGAAGCGAFR